jgi:glycosyltransferase involved in cell wall biosynthesis
MRPPRLLYVVTEDWFFLSHRLPMARAAQAAGFEVHVATTVGKGGAAIMREGFVLHPVRFVRGRLSPVAALHTIRELRRIYREVAPVLIHNVALQPTIFGSLAAIGHPAARVNALTGLGHTFVSSSATTRTLKGVIGLLLRTLLNGERRVALVQNPDDRKVLADLGIDRDRIVLIPGSGVDAETLKPMPEPEGPITVAFVGRLLAIKGIHTLIAALRILRAKGSAPHLLIAGTPDPANPSSVSKAQVEAWAREPGITWLGHVSDISSVWGRAHIAVLPAQGEGLPKSLLEAAACGRPLIASDAPGCREIAIANETGLLVPPDDAEALAIAIDKLASSTALRASFGRAARQLVEERFSAELIGRATTDLYLRLVAASG